MTFEEDITTLGIVSNVLVPMVEENIIQYLTLSDTDGDWL